MARELVEFHGKRDARGLVEFVNCRYKDERGVITEEPLSLWLSAGNHSPTGFEWGYGGSGPMQLALAIVCETLSRGSEEAPRNYSAHSLAMALKWHAVSNFSSAPGSHWFLPVYLLREYFKRAETAPAEEAVKVVNWSY